MKISLFLLSAAVSVAACKNSPEASETTTFLKSDSTFVVQPELPLTQSNAAAPVIPLQRNKATTRNTSASNSPTSQQGNTQTQSGTTVNEKQGWSKTAKGAVIGGVAGAGTGAVVNKRNRLAGAVIGGAIGAGAGAVVGHQMDKKDGRH